MKKTLQTPLKRQKCDEIESRPAKPKQSIEEHSSPSQKNGTLFEEIQSFLRDEEAKENMDVTSVDKMNTTLCMEVANKCRNCPCCWDDTTKWRCSDIDFSVVRHVRSILYGDQMNRTKRGKMIMSWLAQIEKMSTVKSTQPFERVSCLFLTSVSKKTQTESRLFRAARIASSTSLAFRIKPCKCFGTICAVLTWWKSKLRSADKEASKARLNDGPVMHGWNSLQPNGNVFPTEVSRSTWRL